MFDLQIKSAGQSVDDHLRALKQDIEARLRAIAEDTPAQITAQLEAGKGPSGGAQPPLLLATIEQKQSKGYHAPSTPGVATGLLSTPSAWVVRDDGQSYIITPPSDRVDVAGYLEDLGYEIVAVPSDTLAAVDRVIKDAIAGR
jgi:hypothetical protein